jgi:hypothetical protein
MIGSGTLERLKMTRRFTWGYGNHLNSENNILILVSLCQVAKHASFTLTLTVKTIAPVQQDFEFKKLFKYRTK